MALERKILVGLDLEGLAGFLLFLVVLLALLIWIVYKLAAILLPAALLVAVGLVAVWFPLHQWEQATIGARGQRSLAACLAEIHALERTGASRDLIAPAERQAREAAQALADSAYSRFRRVTTGNRRSWLVRKRPEQEQRQQQERVLVRELENLRLTHSVVPDPDPWRRVSHLYRQRGWYRWLVEHPRPATLIIASGLLVLLALAAGVLNRLG